MNVDPAPIKPKATLSEILKDNLRYHPPCRKYVRKDTVYYVSLYSFPDNPMSQDLLDMASDRDLMGFSHVAVDRKTNSLLKCRLAVETLADLLLRSTDI